MSKRLFLCSLVLAVASAGFGVSLEAQQRPGDQDFKSGPNDRAPAGIPATRPAARPQSGFRANPEAMGTIIYDNGIVTATPGISSYMFGNRFNTGAGVPVLASGTLTQLSFFIVTGAGTDNVFISLYGAPSGTTAPFVDDNSVPLNNGSGMFNTAAFPTPNVYAGSSFLAGVWYVAGDTVGLGSGTVNAQGSHGIAINDIVGTDFQTLPGLNALVGATGNILTPVELMQFSVSNE